MSSALRKLLGINIWNGVYSSFNFLSNLIVVRALGTAFFGEFSLLNVYVSISALIYILIPGNIALFRYQDEERFKDIYFSFFSYISFIYVIILIFIWFFIKDTALNLSIFIFYSVSLVWYNYIDVTYQASGRLNKYFIILALSAIFKCIIIIICHWLKLLNSINDLLLYIGIPQFVFLTFSIYYEKKKSNINFVKPLAVLYYIINNIKIFIPYYLNTSLKRLQDQTSIFVFNFFVDKSTLGIYSLLIKSVTFISSLVRVIEAYFTNRLNFKAGFKATKKYSLIMGFIIQIICAIFTIIYMYVMLNILFIKESLILSFFFLFYVLFLLSRVESLSEYRIKYINISEIIHIILIPLLIIIFNYFHSPILLGMLFTFVLANMVQQIVVILSLKSK
jgi:O-antigen/teichoic acid export membrane protein